ncbi:maestro heat-like repeat-containing protein family member 1 [Trichonephila clavipes]|uniref:Maestro heat-like repeat-containing protein family member 1 n=1 Tax=Trichonephila clavipes TaxID=2585209 RepID=A0A8X6V602_TRICX|nr:maestro heat-like repeat-containing protein family member 1 [Trichonephila clavipes]
MLTWRGSLKGEVSARISPSPPDGGSELRDVEFTGDSDHEKLKATIILCYGHITVNTSILQISPRIETPILRCVANLYSSSKDPIVKQSMLETIKLIADAVQNGQQKKQCLDELRSRSELLGLMRTILKSETSQPLTSNCRKAIHIDIFRREACTIARQNNCTTAQYAHQKPGGKDCLSSKCLLFLLIALFFEKQETLDVATDTKESTVWKHSQSGLALKD